MPIKHAYRAAWLCATLTVGGCGTYVPEINDNPFLSERQKSDFIQEIVRNVRCEVQDSVVRIYMENEEVDPLNRNLAWLDGWAVQVSLTLTTDEKGTIAPSANVFPPSPPTSIFNLALGASVSSAAQRVNKIGSFFTIKELKDLEACRREDRQKGPFILESDLKLYQWLVATMVSTNNRDTPSPNDPKGPLKSNVLSHQIKFDVQTSGSLTPGFKLVEATVNQSGAFLSATRGRTQEASFTFGPVDPQFSKPVIDAASGRVRLDPRSRRPLLRATELAPAANSVFLATEIGNAVSNGVRAALRP